MKKLVTTADIISAVILLLFLYTAGSKLLNHAEFRLALAGSPVVKPFAGILAWALPAAEILIVVLLFFPSTRLKGMYASLLLLSIFTLYLCCILLFSPVLPCTCGGVIEKLSWPQHIAFNLFFMLLVLTGIWLYHKHQHNLDKAPP